MAALFVSLPAARAELLWGVNGHPFSAYPGISYTDQLQYLPDLGLKYYRVNISDLETADRLDVLIAEAKKRGVVILPVLTPGHLDLDKDSADELFRKVRALAKALGTRFKADIRVWELGNEMENYAIIQPCEMRDDGTKYPCEWGPAGGVGPLEYYGPRWAKVSAVLKGLSVGMTEADPTIRKAMGTAGWGHVGAFERMQEDGIQWDISVWHEYGQDSEWAFKVLARYDRPIWVTEVNAPFGSQKGEQQQSDGLKKAMLRLEQLQKQYRVEAAIIYELLDEPYWAPDFEAVMGLVRVDGSEQDGWRLGEPKPAYGTVRALAKGEQERPLPERACDLARIETAASADGRQVRFAYCLLLGRDAKAEEIGHWGQKRIAFADMALELLGSDEFKARYSPFGMTDRDYVAFLYPLLVGRDADGGGLESYASQLRAGTMTREAVALGLMTSDEFTTRFQAFLATGQRSPAVATPG